MKYIVTTISAGLFALGAFAQDATPAAAPLEVQSAQDVTLGEFLWKKRLVVVFADTDLDPVFQTQLELLGEQPQALLDRDVVVITDTDPGNPTDIRTTLRPRGFGLVLIDKDGQVKLRKPAPWDVREISSSIDKTALRQDELREMRRTIDGDS